MKVRPDGTVKVLDFGLAKALERLDGADHGGRHRELADDHVARDDAGGMILGTAAYMAPEQARGKAGRQARGHLGVRRRPVRDARRGTRAFDGESLVDVLGAVARLEPDFDALPG